MFGAIAGFEFRYQVKSPLFIVAAAFLFVAAFADMSIAKFVGNPGGNVLYNSPHAIIVSHLLASLIFLFLGAAFVSNVVVRDDHTGFGPILRSSRVRKFDYLFGRLAGGAAAGALLMSAVTLGAGLGTLMPFAEQAMLGPNRLAAFAYGLGFFALPNALIISAILFALATATRSTAGTFIGIVVLLVFYLVSQRIMENQPDLLTFRVLTDPFGMTAYMASSRYFTASELNGGTVPITSLMVQGRLLWISLSAALLGLTYSLFRFSDRGISSRQQRKLARQAAAEASAPAPHVGYLPKPRFDHRAARAQVFARAAMEAGYILTSPVLLILIGIAFVFTLAGLLTASGWNGVSVYPLPATAIPTIEASFRTILIIIATYYGGELVWRERERKVHEIVDATPLPEWALMLPKMLGLALVLIVTLAVGMTVGLLVQWLNGGTTLVPTEYLSWNLLPGTVDSFLIAALSVCVQTLSPSKYAGWGVMVLYIFVLIFGPSMGLDYPLLVYGNVPAVPLFDMSGTGNFGSVAWWVRLFWAAAAVLLLVAAQLAWRRGADQELRRRLRSLKGTSTLVASVAGAILLLSGSWIVYNTLVLNEYRTAEQTLQYLADYETRYFRYADLPQPSVKHVDLNVALFPEKVRAEVRGRYRLVNETAKPIERVHVRLLNDKLVLDSLEFPGASLERIDEAFAYRIYRLKAPMQPGEGRWLSFRTHREQRGFRASGTESEINSNGTYLDSLDLTPRIGMSDVGLIDDPATRRDLGLPKRHPFPRLDDRAATMRTPSGSDAGWATATITIATSADQIAIAPGKAVFDRVEGDRRVTRYVSTVPSKNLFSIQSAKYAVRKLVHDGVEHAVYFHPGHDWNVDRMLAAMRASTAYYGEAFGPYQLNQLRLVERPTGGGGQAFPNTIGVGEGIFTMDLRDPQQLDMVTMLTAHEVAHQWWGHQVLGARMQGGALIYETLAQYSALMVLKRLRGEADIHRFLQFQRDRYLSGRRAQALGEEPLVSAGIDQDYVNYAKGALALYHLQHRIGEAAVNRALRRFSERYRFTTAPYPRSLDLIAFLRAEAKLPEDQALITDLFERITIYDLRVERPKAHGRTDGKWIVTVPVDARKFYAEGDGTQKEAALNDIIEIGLFTEKPGSGPLNRQQVIRVEPRKLRSGKQVVTFVTDKAPAFAVVDPYNLFIDRTASDNVDAVLN